MTLAGASMARADGSAYWRALSVRAELDKAGVMHVVERHEMIFDGPSNGGYRDFRVDMQQSLEIESVTRIDQTGTRFPLREGNLSRVDDYKLEKGKTLKWRSREPSDPEYHATPLTYELSYRLLRVLTKKGDRYHLDHDFAFPERKERIERFVLDFAMDPAWQATGEGAGSAAHIEKTDLQAGQGVVGHFVLTRSGEVPRGAFVEYASSTGIDVAWFFLLGGAGLLVLWFLVGQGRAGRFGRVVPRTQINELWLREHLLDLSPEVVGASWDDEIGAPEVAALIARLVQEKKLESHVRTVKILFFSKEVLHLKLLQPVESFAAHEQALLRKLFIRGPEVSTDDLKSYYVGTGFDPSSTIASYLKEARHPDLADLAPKPSYRVVFLLYMAGLLACVGALFQMIGNIVAPITFVFVSVFCLVVAVPLAVTGKKRLVGALWRLPWVTFFAILPGCIMLAGFTSMSTTQALLGTSLLSLGNLALVLNLFSTRDGKRRLVRRLHLASAREYFIYELKQKQPRLRDEWFPYALAFGLDKNIGRWFRRFGALQTGPVFIGGHHHHGSGMGGGGGDSPWTGGGGAFGGAGATGSFIGAIGGFSTGVSAPSSSSSGGGSFSSGGSSSGGGGGGSW